MKYLMIYLLVGAILSLVLTAMYTLEPRAKRAWDREFGDRTISAFVILDLLITLCWLPALLWAGFLSLKEWRNNGKRG